ncbi:MAG: hypothetical protein L6Q60_10455 [Rhodocyclaceae bacterium]|nr:hypothetical protein [Rhodocyclaceae bacterium]
MISLIIMVVMTIGAVSLMRTVDTTNLVAGNLAFQQAATRSAEAGIEDAIRNVLETGAATSLWNDDLTRGYVASTPASGTPTDWDAYWRTTLNPNPIASPSTPRSCADRVCSLPTDASGNRVSYHVQRLCLTTGDPLSDPTGCASAERKSPLEGNPLNPNAPKYKKLSQYYYRITVRVTGPRNTVSFVQAIVTK